jgi:membrane protein YqaA with SNARE-associated domain
MRSFLIGIFGSLMTWWGLWLIAALDSTMVFFLPLAVDIAVIVLASRTHEMFWVYPIFASAGSICGAAVTFYIGRRVGDAELERFVSPGRLASVRRKIKSKGAVAIAVLDLVPPPFPFTAFILVAGALKVSVQRFFITLFVSRMVRFGAEAVLAYFYGRQIISWFRSETFEYIGWFLFGVAMFGTALATIQLIRSTRAGRSPSRHHRAA